MSLISVDCVQFLQTPRAPPHDPGSLLAPRHRRPFFIRCKSGLKDRALVSEFRILHIKWA